MATWELTKENYSALTGENDGSVACITVLKKMRLPSYCSIKTPGIDKFLDFRFKLHGKYAGMLSVVVIIIEQLCTYTSGFNLEHALCPAIQRRVSSIMSILIWCFHTTTLFTSLYFKTNLFYIVTHLVIALIASSQTSAWIKDSLAAHETSYIKVDILSVSCQCTPHHPSSQSQRTVNATQRYS